MTQLAKPSLSVKWWDTVRPKSVRGKDLESALGQYEKVARHVDDDDPQTLDDLSSALTDVIDAATRTTRECDRSTDRDVISALQGLVGIAKRERERRDAQAKAKSKETQRTKDADDDDAEAENAPLLAPKRLKALIKVAQKSPLPFACGYAGKVTYFVLDRTRRGVSLKSALEKAAPCKGSTFGTARVEDGVLLLTVDGPPLTGLRKRVDEFLRGNQPLPVRKSQVVGEPETADVDAADEGAAGGAAGAPLPTPKEGAKDDPKVFDTEPPAGSFKIRAAVGRGGANKPEDVTAVQQALNEHGAKLTVDGRIGPATIKAIQDFQRKVGFKKPDGRIDPGRRTEAALRDGKLSADDLAAEKAKPEAGADEPAPVDREQRKKKLKEVDPGTKERIKKVLEAVAKQRKLVEAKVTKAFVDLRDVEPNLAGTPAGADLVRMRGRLEREVDIGKQRSSELTSAADALIANPNTLARREFDDAARTANTNLQDQSAAAEAASTFALTFDLE
jgi:peptidoglycan hydrolase-like protein with peptidoglycan-binding domain